MASSVIDYVLHSAIGPPRCTYEPNGECNIITGLFREVFVRQQYRWTIAEMSIEGSIWRQDGVQGDCCVIYIHSLGVCQFECINLVPFMVTQEVSLCSFDLPGCGRSGGVAVPLDGSGVVVLQRLLDILRGEGFTRFALWGRCLGASIALHAAGIELPVTCVVADSAFHTARDVVWDMAAEQRIPTCLLSLLYPWLRRRARISLSLDIDSRFPSDCLAPATAPVLMGHGVNDTFVLPRHSELLYERYGGRHKMLYLFGASHNSARPYAWYQLAGRFVCRHLGLPPPGRTYWAVFGCSELHVGDTQLILRELAEHVPPQVLPPSQSIEDD